MSRARSRKRAIVGPVVERGTEVCERLDAVDDVGVALPLDHRLARHVGIEHVAAGVDATALTVAHEVGDERFARVDHGCDLGRGEHPSRTTKPSSSYCRRSRSSTRLPRKTISCSGVTLPRTFEAMAQPEEVRVEVRDWLASHWDPDLALVEWRTLLADSGWACPSWPEEWYGRGLPAWADEVVARRVRATRARSGRRSAAGMGLAAPTILAHGPDALRRGSSARSSPASTRGASCSASPAAAPTSPASRPAPSATATSG